MPDLNSYFLYFLDSLVFTIIDALTVAIGVVILVWVVSLAIPSLRKFNFRDNQMAVAVFLSVVLLVFAIISASGILASFSPTSDNLGSEQKMQNER